MIKTLICKKL